MSYGKKKYPELKYSLFERLKGVVFEDLQDIYNYIENNDMNTNVMDEMGRSIIAIMDDESIAYTKDYLIGDIYVSLLRLVLRNGGDVNKFAIDKSNNKIVSYLEQYIYYIAAMPKQKIIYITEIIKICLSYKPKIDDSKYLYNIVDFSLEHIGNRTNMDLEPYCIEEYKMIYILIFKASDRNIKFYKTNYIDRIVNFHLDDLFNKYKNKIKNGCRFPSLYKANKCIKINNKIKNEIKNYEKNILLILCVHNYNSDNILHKDFLPIDILKLIIDLILQ